MPMYRPRLLDQLGSKFSGFGSSRNGKKRGRRVVRETAHLMAETLEKRVMLTTITTTAGNPATFTYKSIVQTYPNVEPPTPSAPDGRYVEIQQSGDTSAEYVGAYVDELGNTQLTNLPGVFGDGTTSNGGFGGERGTQLYGQDEIDDPFMPALSYDPFNAAGTTALRIDSLAAYANSGTLNGVLFGFNVAMNGSSPVLQLIEFPNSNKPQPVGSQYAPEFQTGATAGLNRGRGIVIDDIVLPQDPMNPNSLMLDGTPPVATMAQAVTAAAFNTIDGRLYFVVDGSGPTHFNELYSVDVSDDGNNINPPMEITQSLTKSPGDFGAIAAVQGSTGVAAVVATTDQVSAITFHQDTTGGNATATMYAFVVETAPVPPSQANPLGGAGTPIGYLAKYAFNSTAANFGVNGRNGRQVDVESDGLGETTQITGLSFENDQPGVNPSKIYATTSSLGPATGGSSGATASGGEIAALIRIDLTQANPATYPAIVIADLANPNANAATTAGTLGNDIQDFTWEPDAYDPILDFNAQGIVDVTTPSGAFVGTDATTNELAVISTNPRPAGAYLFSIYVTAGSLSNSIIAVASPLHSEYDTKTGLDIDLLAPSGALSPLLGSSGDVLVEATNLKTADGFSRAPAGTGYAYLGLKGAGLQPITTAETPGFGLIPAGQVQAGLTTAAGVDIDEFVFGGTVTGNVDFGGNAYTFYSGWLITGNTQGFGGSTFVETINGAPTTGDYAISVTTMNGTQTTVAPPDLTYDSPATDVQTALEGVGIVGQFGANAVTVSGPNGGPYTIQFAAGLGVVTLAYVPTATPLTPAGDPPVSFTELTPPSGLESTDDLRDVWVQSDAGGEPTPGFVADSVFDTTDVNGDFNSELEPVIGGHIDQFRAIDNFQGELTVDDAAQGFGINDEIDPDTGIAYVQQKLLSFTGNFANGDIVEGNGVFNNAFTTPQYLGALSTANPVVELTGILNGTNPIAMRPGDNVNYYAVSLLAGQTITVQLDAGDALNLGVFDPDDRLIATDYSIDQGSGVYGNTTINQPFQIKVTMPGSYRFAVAYPTDTAFSGLPIDDGAVAYTLSVGTAFNLSTGVAIPVTGKPGDIALGGLYLGSFSAGSISTTNASTGVITLATGVSSVEVINGDLGAVHADGSITNVDAIVDVGNLRDMDAADIGTKTGNAIMGYTLADALDISVPVGGIGMLRTTDTAGILAVEPLNPDPNVLDPITHSDMTPEGGIYVGEPVGTTIQVVDAASTLACDLSVNYAIGTIQSGDQAVGSPNTFAVNPDNNPAIAGRIDLIDCTGNFGTLASGGPAITTGPNGDVGFINVGGAVFQDQFFGAGTPTTTLHDPGVPVTLTDDGGAVITLTPVGTLTPNPAYNASAPVAGVPAMLGPQLELTTYGIRGSGGVVIINVTVTNDGSLDVSTAGDATSQVAEITNIDVTAAGPNVINVADAATTTTNASTGAVTNVSNSTIISPTLSGASPAGGNTAPNSNLVPIEIDPASTLACTVEFSGSNNLNVYDITGGNFTSIINHTAGEIVNINATSIGALVSVGPIGVPVTSTPAALYPAQVISNAFPFDEQHYGIVSGSIVQVVSSSAIGNLNVTGTIGSLIADSGHANSPGGTFAGIDGPIVASGQIQYVDIGQGILSSGTGTVSFAGLYADGAIGLVTNTQPGADIRGSVVSETEINAVVLNNASIINASIDTVTPFAGSDDEPPAAELLSDLSVTQESPVWTIGQITIKGDGGIIGDLIRSGAIGPTLVTAGGFGIFFSEFEANDGDGQIASVTASGYGIRGDLFDGGSSFAGLNATGNGSLVSTDTIDPALFVSRQTTSTLTAFNPFSGLLPSQLDDLDLNLQTGAADPNIPGRTDTGAIEDSSADGSRNLGSLVAQSIREVVQVDDEGAPLLPNPTTAESELPGTADAFGTEFNFANSIGSVHVRGAINGLELTTGRLGTFNALSIARMGITVAGTITRMLVRGDYGKPINSGEVLGSQVAAGDSFIQAVGPHGTIGNLTITGNLNGTILATASIYALTVYGSIRGNVTSMGESKGLALGTLHVGAFLDQSSLDVTGSVGSIIANGGFGVAGDSLTITGNLGSLQVGALRSNTNNSLGMALTVDGSIGRITVRGHIDGSISAGGNITSLAVSSDGSTPNLINGPVHANGSIGTVSLTNGNLISSVTAGGSIRSVSLSKGSVNAGASFQSANGSISAFRITGGTPFGMFGSLLAPNGVRESVQVSGNIGDGTDPALITASSGTTFHVQGSILSNVTITLSNYLNLLQVDGNVDTGAVISANPLKKLKIKGTNTGSITVI